jgi:hypothetical protein
MQTVLGTGMCPLDMQPEILLNDKIAAEQAKLCEQICAVLPTVKKLKRTSGQFTFDIP